MDIKLITATGCKQYLMAVEIGGGKYRLATGFEVACQRQDNRTMPNAISHIPAEELAENVKLLETANANRRTHQAPSVSDVLTVMHGIGCQQAEAVIAMGGNP